jgi:hypothetical protein
MTREELETIQKGFAVLSKAVVIDRGP